MHGNAADATCRLNALSLAAIARKETAAHGAGLGFRKKRATAWHTLLNVDILAVELHALRLEVQADASEDHSQVIDHFPGENSASIFRHEDQMYVEHENAVRPAP